MNSKSPNTGAGEIVTANWEAEATVTRHGRRGAKKFVRTKDVVRIDNPLMERSVIDALRRGGDVRLFGGSVRLYPILDEELGLVVCAQVLLGTAIRDCLKDIQPKFVKGKDREEQSREEVVKLCEEANAKRRESESWARTLSHVTPDMVIVCDRCGHEMRVGKKLT